jgi:cell division protein FtsX
MHTDKAASQTVKVDGWTRRERFILIIAAITTFIVASVSLVGSWQTGSNLTAYVQCQSQWNSFLHRALEARTNASTEATVAMDELINAITEAKSADQTREALNKYKAARANQLQKQRENPLPPPPDQVCEI